MLKVSVDLKQGIYIISEDDGQKTISVPIDGKYDKKTINEIRDEIQRENRHIVAREKLELIDVGVYQAIKQYDSQYGTNHAYNYADAIGKEIFNAYYDFTSKDYKSKMAGIRAEELNRAGINVEYNVSLLGGLGKLKFGERLRAIRTALSQKKNGINVSFENGKKLALPVPENSDKKPEVQPTTKVEPQITSQQPVTPSPAVNQTQQPQVTSNMPPVAPVIPAPKPNVVPTPEVQIDPKQIETLTNQNQQNIDELIKTARSQGIENQVNPIKPKDEPEEPDLASEFEERRVASERRTPQTPKKKISRSKSKQASKQAQREAGKLKNSYQSRIDAKAKRREVAERIKAEGPKPKKEKQQQKPQPQPAKKTKKPIAYSPKGAKSQEGSIVTRFTRKIKDKADSIHNKKFLPSLNKKQKKIARAATLVALVGTLAIGMGYRVLSNSNEINIDNPTNTPQVVEKVEPEQNLDKDGIDYVLGVHDVSTQTPSEKPTEIQTPSIEDVKPSAPIIEETGDKEQDSKEAYLSSIKVGTAMNITSGKYFETPEGTGNYGHFENFTDGVKEINMIDVITEEGYKVIKDDSVNLFELKQQYPNAKFAYHMICRNQDGTVRTLGWLTEDSMDQNLQQSRLDVEDVDR